MIGAPDGVETQRPGSPPRRAKLVDANFLAVSASMFLLFVHVGFILGAVPRYVEGPLGWGETGTGLTLVAFSTGAVASRPVISIIGARFGSRVLMLAGGAVSVLAVGVILVHESMAALIVGRALSGIGEAALFVGATTITTQAAGSERRAEAASYVSLGVFAGIGIGPWLSGVMFNDSQYRATFLAAGGFAAVAALLALRVREPHRALTATDSAAPRGRSFHPAAFPAGLALAIGMASYSTFAAFVPNVAADLGFSGRDMAFGAYAVVCVVLRLAGAKGPEKIGVLRAAPLAVGGIGSGLLLLSQSHSAATAIAATVVLGAGISWLYPSLLSIAANAVGDSERIAVISTFTMFFEIGTAIGGISFGALAEAVGKRASMFTAAWCCVGGVLYCLTYLRRWATAHTVSA